MGMREKRERERKREIEEFDRGWIRMEGGKR